MIQINKKEAQSIRANLRGVPVVICNRQGNSKKKTYYVESSPWVTKHLEKFHKDDKIEHYE